MRANISKESFDDKKLLTRLMMDKFVGTSALCKNWHCIFLLNFVQIAKGSQEGPMQILFDQSKLDRILARAVSIPHVCIVLRPIQFLKSSSQSWKEMTSCRKISFHLLWFTHKVPISNVHTRWNKTFTFDFNIRYLAQKLNLYIVFASSIYWEESSSFFSNRIGCLWVAVPWEIYLHKIVCNFFPQHFQWPFKIIWLI